VAGGLVRSAVPGQQAAEKEATKSSFEMLNIPTPATDGSVYLKSSRGRPPLDTLEMRPTEHRLTIHVQFRWTTCRRRNTTPGSPSSYRKPWLLPSASNRLMLWM
jgi:hypothetical protein